MQRTDAIKGLKIIFDRHRLEAYRQTADPKMQSEIMHRLDEARKDALAFLKDRTFDPARSRADQIMKP